MSIQLTKLIADFDTQLAAPISIGATTASLVSVTDDDGNTIPNGTYGFTIDAGNSSKEYIICTLTSTALTAVYSITRQGVATSGFVRNHRRGAKVTITDWSAMKGIQNVLEVGYASATTPTTDYMLATKKYVDDASFIGATNASTTTPGVVELPTQAEVDAKTASGGLGPLVVTPDTLRATKYNDAVASATGTDSYAITVAPAITAYVTGQEFTFIADVANTGACALNVSGLGAKTIKKDVSSDLATGDILAGQTVKVIYDGTNMQLVSRNGTTATPAINYKAGSATYNLSTASGTQTIAHGLGATPTMVKITGGSGYDAGNSFGSSTSIYFNSTQSSWNAYETSSTTEVASADFRFYTSNAEYQTGIITVDSTNITITWTRTGATASVTAYLVWEVQY